MQVLKREMSFPRVCIMSERHFLEKYVNSNAKYSILWDIDQGEDVGKLIIDKGKMQ
jgi:hypothetical protein